MPETWGLMRISWRGWTLPEANVFKTMSVDAWRFRAVGCFGLLFLVAQMLDRVHRARQNEQHANQEGNKFSVFHVQELRSN